MYKRTVLKNGLNIISSTMSNMASVSIGVWVNVGGRHEPGHLSGISHLIEHMLFKGTLSRSAKQLKQSIEGVGGAFNGFTSDEATCYMVKVPKKHMELGVDILTDMVLHPKMDRTDLAREKFVIYEEIKMYRDQPSEYVLELLAKLMWPGNSLGRPLTGTIETVTSMNRPDLKSFCAAHYHPGNISVISAGDVSHKKLSDLSEKHFSERTGLEKTILSPPSMEQGAVRYKFSRGNGKQAHIAMGFYSPDKREEDRLAVSLMSIILGGNMSSRLFEGLREKQGLCYDISSIHKKHSDVGELQIHAGVDNSKTASAVSAIIKELSKIKTRVVSEGELMRAKEFLKGQFLLAIEGTSTRMLWLGDRFVVHGRIPEVKHVLKKIDSVSRADIKKAAREVFDQSSINMAVISRIGEKDKNALIRNAREL